MVEYKYNAWGNHAVLDANGEDISDAAHIGNKIYSVSRVLLRHRNGALLPENKIL